ncbi:hypothetical protein N7536_004758 [Penicillium majusculum]|nr:hypothetical protein N7536_004758 [Penicillium majusculum]
MQQATYWFNSAKWKEEKAAKQTLREDIEALTWKIDALDMAYNEVLRDVTRLQKAILDKD